MLALRQLLYFKFWATSVSGYSRLSISILAWYVCKAGYVWTSGAHYFGWLFLHKSLCFFHYKCDTKHGHRRFFNFANKIVVTSKYHPRLSIQNHKATYKKVLFIKCTDCYYISFPTPINLNLYSHYTPKKACLNGKILTLPFGRHLCHSIVFWNICSDCSHHSNEHTMDSS